MIDGVAGRVDDGDIRAGSPESLGDIPPGQIVPKLNIGDDDIDPSPILQVPESLVCVARFENVVAGAAQRLGKVQARQRIVFYDENGNYRTIQGH
jgi:hypothetical protein